MSEITVNGEAGRSVPADRVTLQLRLSAEGGSRDEVYQRVVAAQHETLERVNELVSAGSATHYSAEPVRTWSDVGYVAGQPSEPQHRAQAQVVVTVGELALVGELSAEFSRRGADVGVEWLLSDEVRREVTRELRAEAVAQAREAAEDFAAAIGAARVTLEALSEGGGAGAGPLRRAHARAMSAAVPEVTVGDIEVRVGVEARFTAGA